MTLAEDAQRLMVCLHAARDAYLGEGFALPLESEAVRQMGITLFLEGRRGRESGRPPEIAPSVGRTAFAPAASSVPLDVEALRAACLGKLAREVPSGMFTAALAYAESRGKARGGTLRDWGRLMADGSALAQLASLLGVPLP